MDLELWGKFACCLYDKNEVIVYDMKSKKAVFKSAYKEVVEQITKLYYVSDFVDGE